MAYSYDHDCPFEAFITNLGRYNEGDLVGEWVKFPTTPEELQNVFDRIGIGSKDEFEYVGTVRHRESAWLDTRVGEIGQLRRRDWTLTVF